MMKYMDRVLFGGFLLIGLSASFDVQACSLSAWSSNTGSGSVQASQPDGLNSDPGSPTTLVSRVSQKCGMIVNKGAPASTPAYVQDNSPDESTDSRIIARFYVLVSLSTTGSLDVFEAFDDDAGTTSKFKVEYDADLDSFVITGGTSTMTLSAGQGWNMVELDYDGGTGAFAAEIIHTSYGTSNPSDSTTGASGTIGSVRLGAPNGFNDYSGSSLMFDNYQAHRTTPVGPELIGDANDDGNVNIFDYGAVQLDAAGTFQDGQPDCNMDGAVNIFDYGCVQTVAGS